MDTSELSKYAKNYLPLLFNVYIESSAVDSNSFMLDCIQSYASISDPPVCVTMSLLVLSLLLLLCHYYRVTVMLLYWYMSSC